MEQPTSSVNPAPSAQNKTKKFNGLLFLEVGLVEVLSVIFVLLLIFGIFNYFGILPVSESFPFLSFLPQKQKAIIDNSIKINTSEIPLKYLTFQPKSSTII